VTVATNQDVAELLRRAWVFTMPSVYEGFGVPYVEAMASGTAIVTTPNAGALELFGTANAGGELVAEHALGSTIADLLLDHARRDELARCGRAASAQYDWPVVAARYERVYADATHQ
jgi:glycosyltransferase involved in cell wall biosynthesis